MSTTHIAETGALDPPYFLEAYKSTHLRAPKKPLLQVPAGILDLPGPMVPPGIIGAKDTDLTCHGKSAPVGEKMVVRGRILDEFGKPVRRSLVELWQCNSAGRYHHPVDTHDAPLDPNFFGKGQTLTDDDGRYCFITIKPGAYPWTNLPFAWRPQHIHFSLLGNVYAQRLVTQMYFPGDPLLEFDPVYNSVPDEAARKRMIAHLVLEEGIQDIALGYHFDIVLAGARSTPMGM